MGKKRKGTDRGRGGQNQSYQNLIAQQTLNKFQPYINSMVKQEVYAIAQQQKQLVENLYVRIRVLEELLAEKYEDVTKESLAYSIAEIEDRQDGYEAADVVQENDRVRVEIATKTQDQEEFQGSSKLMIDRVGSGQTLGKELEGAMLGMKNDEVKEIKFGKDESMTAQITLNRVSRSTKKEETQEQTDESNNAGQQDRSPEAGETVQA